VDPVVFHSETVTWRSYESSYDAAELEPSSRQSSTYVLQEYFVPVARFDAFAARLREILRRHRVNVINISIRHARRDPSSLLSWAREDVFGFVIYYKQGTAPDARERVATWTRELIDSALDSGGTYYLPYQLHATVEQFHRAYPRAAEFFALKQQVDPRNRFRNALWDKYYRPEDSPRRP
jgi:FAD/FMN-containing dehydrogenase